MRLKLNRDFFFDFFFSVPPNAGDCVGGRLFAFSDSGSDLFAPLRRRKTQTAKLKWKETTLRQNYFD